MKNSLRREVNSSTSEAIQSGNSALRFDVVVVLAVAHTLLLARVDEESVVVESLPNI